MLNSAWLHIVGDKVDHCVNRICYFGVAVIPREGEALWPVSCSGLCVTQQPLCRALLRALGPHSAQHRRSVVTLHCSRQPFSGMLLHCGILTLTELLLPSVQGQQQSSWVKGGSGSRKWSGWCGRERSGGSGSEMCKDFNLKWNRRKGNGESHAHAFRKIRLRLISHKSLIYRRSELTPQLASAHQESVLSLEPVN